MFKRYMYKRFKRTIDAKSCKDAKDRTICAKTICKNVHVMQWCKRTVTMYVYQKKIYGTGKFDRTRHI